MKLWTATFSINGRHALKKYDNWRSFCLDMENLLPKLLPLAEAAEAIESLGKGLNACGAWIFSGANSRIFAQRSLVDTPWTPGQPILPIDPTEPV